MNASIITPPGSAKIKYRKISYNKTFIRIESIVIKPVLIDSFIEFYPITNQLRNRKISAEIVKYFTVDPGGDGIANRVIFSFTQADLINNRLRRVHNFNTDAVDVSVFENDGKEISVGLILIDRNTIELDFTRVSVIGIWKILIEA